MTDLTPLSSSMVNAAGYDADTQTLVIEYNSGARWQYANVPADVYERLRDARSAGAFVATHVKGVYVASKVEDTAGKPDISR